MVSLDDFDDLLNSPRLAMPLNLHSPQGSPRMVDDGSHMEDDLGLGEDVPVVSQASERGWGVSERNYEEGETPLGPPTPGHFMMDIASYGYFDVPGEGETGLEGETGAGSYIKMNKTKSKTKLHCAVNLTELQNIDVQGESFDVRMRLYLVWTPEDDPGPGRDLWEHYRDAAIKAGHYLHLSPTQTKEFLETVRCPSIGVFNAQSQEKTDSQPSVRVYGGNGGAVMWNLGYKVTCHQHFDLRNFPFDRQELAMELRIDDLRIWNDFDFSVCSVQFHRNALALPEWYSYEPVVQRMGQFSFAGSTIKLQVVRKPYFFLTSIIGIVLMLSSLSLVLFSLPVEALMDRLNVILTLLLTEITFKFIIAETIPKIGHSTLLDDFVIRHLVYLCLLVVICTAAFHLDVACDAQLAQQAACSVSRRSRRACVQHSLDHPLSSGGEALSWVCSHQTVVCTNVLSMGVTILLFLALNLSWLWRVAGAVYVDEAPTTRAMPDPDLCSDARDASSARNWWACMYTTPAFLPPPKRFSDEEEENQASFSLHASSSSDLQRRSSFAHAHQPSSSAPAFAAAPHDHELAVYSKLVADVSVSGSDFVRVPSALVSEVGVSDRMSSLASSGGYHVSDHATRRAPGWHVSHDVTKLASEDEASDDSTKVASGSHVTSTHDTSNLASEASGTLGSEHSATAGEGGDTFKRLV